MAVATTTATKYNNITHPTVESILPLQMPREDKKPNKAGNIFRLALEKMVEHIAMKIHKLLRETSSPHPQVTLRHVNMLIGKKLEYHSKGAGPRYSQTFGRYTVYAQDILNGTALDSFGQRGKTLFTINGVHTPFNVLVMWMLYKRYNRHVSVMRVKGTGRNVDLVCVKVDRHEPPHKIPLRCGAVDDDEALPKEIEAQGHALEIRETVLTKLQEAMRRWIADGTVRSGQQFVMDRDDFLAETDLTIAQYLSAPSVERRPSNVQLWTWGVCPDVCSEANWRFEMLDIHARLFATNFGKSKKITVQGL